MFTDRGDAGRRLAESLEKYRDRGVLVLAIPRGGVEVGLEVARFLNADFSIVITRKLPTPDDPEAGFGAIAEDGSTYIFERVARWIHPDLLESIKDEQSREIERRKQVLRRGWALPEIAGRTIILVDDGIAMGSTMMASIALCRKQKAAWIVAAAPVAGPDTARALENEADEVVVLETPRFFRAVAQAYQNWYDVPDREVIEILERWERGEE